MKQENQQEVEESRKAGRKVLTYMLCFFVVFACVDAFFVYKALSTYSGEVTENAYEKGLKFNDIIAEARKRKQEQEQQNHEHGANAAPISAPIPTTVGKPAEPATTGK